MVSPGVRVPCPNEMLEHQLHRERQQEWTGRGVKRAQFAALTGTTDLLKRGSLYATPGKAAFRDTHAKGIMATMLGPEWVASCSHHPRAVFLQHRLLQCTGLCF